MSAAVDVAFFHAVRAAANGQSKLLDDYLRSGAPLGAAERDMLADLDKGLLRPVSGRGAALTQAQRRYYAARYIAGGADKRAMADVVAETGMDRTTVLGWVRQMRSALAIAPDNVDIIQIVLSTPPE